MIAADTSVSVPALLSWHEAHTECRHAARGAAIPAHALAETYSVLTRLPRFLTSGDAARLLAAAFPPDRVLLPSAELQHRLVARCADADIVGGAVYDAYIGLTAAEGGALLLTRDRRAARAYEALGVEISWV